MSCKNIPQDWETYRRPCPKCYRWIEKAPDSRQMVCIRCNLQFCIKCEMIYEGSARFHKCKRIVFTKNCPKCRFPIEKTGGCDYMICCKCHTHFCWDCGQPFSTHEYCEAETQLKVSSCFILKCLVDSSWFEVKIITVKIFNCKPKSLYIY